MRLKFVPTEEEIGHIRRLWRVPTLWALPLPYTGAAPHLCTKPTVPPVVKAPRVDVQLPWHCRMLLRRPTCISFYIDCGSVCVKSEHWASGSDGRKWGLQQPVLKFWQTKGLLATVPQYIPDAPLTHRAMGGPVWAENCIRELVCLIQESK